MVNINKKKEHCQIAAKMVIIMRDIQNQEGVTRKVLAEKLKVSERTISRYIKRLKEDLKLPIVYNPYKNQYEFYRSNYEELPRL